MPFAEIAGGSLHYRIDGPNDAPALVLSNSLGTDLALWDRQVPALSRSFRIVRYDTRGHGRSLDTPGPYTMELLGRDVVGLLDHLHIARAHFAGVSMGGMVGMWLAAHEPARIEALVLANTAAFLGPREAWEKRIATVLSSGIEAIAASVVERWFTPAFREKQPAAVATVRTMLLASPPQGYCACCAAIRDMDQRARLAAIRARTLVIAGAQDPATPPAMGREIAAAVTGARYVELCAAHLSNIEAAEAFNDAVADFLLT